jgi:tetratricopeptide (TPR) repeat protein
MIEQNRGVLANMRGDLDDAELLYSRSLSAFEGANDQEAISWVLNNLGKLYTQRGDHDKARTHIERALAIAGDGDATVESILTLNLAEVFIGAGQLELADDACRRAFDKAQRRGDHLTAAGALKCRAHVERERGALDKSMATLRIAIFESQGTQDRLLQAELLRELGEISRALGNASAAKAAWREAAQAYEGAGARGDAAEIESRISDLGTPS